MWLGLLFSGYKPNTTDLTLVLTPIPNSSVKVRRHRLVLCNSLSFVYLTKYSSRQLKAHKLLKVVPNFHSCISLFFIKSNTTDATSKQELLTLPEHMSSP